MVKQKNTIEAIFNKLNMVERGVLFKYINDESQAIMMGIANDIDHCIVATLIESFPDLSVSQIEEIANGIAKMREEQEPKLEKLRKMSEGDVKKMTEGFTERIDELLIKKVKQNDAIKILKKEFPELPQATIVKTFKKSKEQFKPTSYDDISTEELAEYIVDGIKKEAAITKDSKFKISFMQIQGEYGTYDLDITNAKVNGESIKDIVTTNDKEINHLNKEIEILNKRRIELEMQLQEIKEIEVEFIK